MKASAYLPPDRKALQYAYRLLRCRGRSIKELSERLRVKGFNEQTAANTINSLLHSGFLDDRRLAQTLRDYAERTKLMGIEGVRRFLMERGIPSDIINDTINSADETGVAERLLEKKLRIFKKSGGFAADSLAARKLYRMMQAKGFRPETIIKTIGSLKTYQNEKQ